MSRLRSKLLQVTLALVLLTASAAMLWPLLGTSATYAACPNPSNDVCITNTPTVSLTLNGTNQSASYTLAFTLNSTSSSWHVTITSTQFTSGSHTLSVNASSVTAVATASACSGSTCPQNSITYPVVMSVAPTPAADFYNNTAGGSHGQGTFTIKATINVLFPANTYAGTYTSTITIAFASGP